tara:strand:- start:325 stop:612 length:288 start_codon:yes stop_codon:yes gene_type:complete
MKEKTNYSLAIDGEIFSVPDPLAISSDALRLNGARDKQSGLIIAYDPITEAGGMLSLGEGGEARWIVYVPISQAEFTRKVNSVAGGNYSVKGKVH